MNPQVNTISTGKCLVCGYEIIDLHHIPARSRGGARTIELCPNHHRCANILQALVYQGKDVESIWYFAACKFDALFNETLLNPLLAFELMVDADAGAFYDTCLTQLNKRAMDDGWMFMHPEIREENERLEKSWLEARSGDTIGWREGSSPDPGLNSN